MKHKTIVFFLILLLGLTACDVNSGIISSSNNLPETDLAAEGPVLINGTFEYSNEFVLETYYVEHAVMLTDMTAFILRDLEWELPIDSQVLGYMDVDEENNSATYRLSLPMLPEGQMNDVDQDDKQDSGVQVFVVAYSPNLTGDVFSVGDDRTWG